MFTYQYATCWYYTIWSREYYRFSILEQGVRMGREDAESESSMEALNRDKFY
jgi:hypothetical protein